DGARFVRISEFQLDGVGSTCDAQWPLLARFGGECKDHGIAVVAEVRAWLWGRDLPRSGARYGGLAPYELLHGSVRRDPRTAARRPSGAVMHPDFNPQPLAFFDGVRH